MFSRLYRVPMRNHKKNAYMRRFSSAQFDDIWNHVLPTNNDENLVKVRHSTAHVLAMAVQKLFPGTKVATGPWIENGFYYDFSNDNVSFTNDDLKRIKKEMDKIVKNNFPITKEVVSREDARSRIKAQNEEYKMKILDSIPSNEPISLYHIGDRWWDLCAGPHVERTGDLDCEAISLLSVAGAYWRGDEKSPMLQRIYGTAWQTPEQLKIHTLRLEDAKRRDHRLIGKNLKLFSIQEDAGGGLVFWHANGAVVRKLIEDYWKEQHLKSGYEIVHTPHIANLNLWRTSGHVDFYRNDMFNTMEVDENQYQLKPMNCPFHCLLYKDALRSYRDLPIRWAELGTVYRYERSGALHGLFRVRGFTQDDAHIFCLPEHLESEIVDVLSLMETILRKFGFADYQVMLSTRPKDSVGSNDIWEKSTAALVAALQRKGLQYTIDEGGGAFYGPKIDVKIKDAIGRFWQCSTIQCDFNLPERFDLRYQQSQNKSEVTRPIMVHRAIFGSLERFFGVLIESTGGDFPLWLAPIQLRLLPVVDEVMDYCLSLKRAAEDMGIRVDVDRSGNRLGKLIRNAELEKVPVVGVIGLKEMQGNSVALRTRRDGEVGTLANEKVLDLLKEAIKSNTEFCLKSTD